MSRQLHVVRHGEVYNPEGVLYGRLPGYELSDLGHQMAAAAAHELAAHERPTSRLIASPLIRTRQSAAPIASVFELQTEIDERLIEPTNAFEGQVGGKSLGKPANWPYLLNPFRPSWGEPYKSISKRVLAVMDDAWGAAESLNDAGDIVLVTHQAVVWAAHRTVAGEKLFHNPATRRCSLSSITSFERVGGRWVEVDYRTPAASLSGDSVDVGAV